MTENTVYNVNNRMKSREKNNTQHEVNTVRITRYANYATVRQTTQERGKQHLVTEARTLHTNLHKVYNLRKQSLQVKKIHFQQLTNYININN